MWFAVFYIGLNVFLLIAYGLEWPVRNTFPRLFSLIIDFICLAMLAERVYRQRTQGILLLLIIPLLTFFIYLKCNFTYYNLWLHIFVVLVAILIIYIHLKKSDISSKPLLLLTIYISVLNVVLCCIPDLFFQQQLLYKNNHRLYNQYNVQLADYSVSKQHGDSVIWCRDYELNVSAVTSSLIVTRVNLLGNPTKIVAFCMLDMKGSWTTMISPQLQNHEQRHFDIAEIFSRKINALNSADISGNRLQTEVNRLMQEREAMGNQYDEESMHSLDSIGQQRWNLKIDSLLERL
jgi:hypothetical protein